MQKVWDILGCVVVNGVEYEDNDMLKIVDMYPNGVPSNEWDVGGDLTKEDPDFSIVAMVRAFDHEDSPDDEDDFSGPEALNDFIAFVRMCEGG